MPPLPPSHPPAVTEDVWARFRGNLLRFLRSRLPSDADAEDVLQDVFVRIHEAAGRLDHPDRLQAWVFGIARRAVADFYRARGRRPDDAPAEVESDALPAPAPPPENLAPYRGDHGVHEEVLSWLRPMAEELPEAYGRALVMADFEGRPQREVAEVLGLSLSGAKSRVQRARQMLGEALAACCEVEFGTEGEATAFRRRRPCDPCEDGV